MKCAACNGGLPPGKVIFCPPCFNVLPNKDQREMTSHYMRVCNAERATVGGDHPGVRDKVRKLALKIREVRGFVPLTTIDIASEHDKSAIVIVDAQRKTPIMHRFLSEAS